MNPNYQQLIFLELDLNLKTHLIWTKTKLYICDFKSDNPTTTKMKKFTDEFSLESYVSYIKT